MATLQDIRQKYPGAYDDLSDEQLADKLYTRHYSDMPRSEFDAKVGVPRPSSQLSPDGPPLFPNRFEEAARARGLDPNIPDDLRATMEGESVLDTSGVRQLPAIREQVMGAPQIQQGAVAQAAGQYPAPAQGLQALGPAQGQGNPFAGLSDADARRLIAQLPEDQRDTGLNLWADAFVARERANPSFGQSLDDTVRAIARGTPIGSFMDEASAALSSVTGGSYDEALAYQRARDRAFDKEAPVVSTGLQIGGGLASGLGAAKVIGAATPSASLGGRVVQGAAAGAGAGAVYGAGLGEGGSGNRAAEAAKGLAIGGAIGAGAPLVGAGISNVYSYARNAVQRPQGALSQYARSAIDRVAGALENDGVTAAGGQRTLRTLGNDAQILDLGQNVQAQAGGIAATPSRGMRIINDAVRGRSAGSEARLERAVTQAVGPDINVPKLVEVIGKSAKAKYGPLYEKFRNTPVPLTQDLEELLGRVTREGWPIREAYRLASSQKNAAQKQFFAQIAEDGSINVTRVPNATEWDYLKRALDLAARYGKGDGTAKSYVAKGLAAEVRDGVDAALSPNNPQASVYAQARKVFADKEALTEAVEAGRSAFTRRISPNELREEMAGLSKPEREAFLVGARQYLSDVAGNAATRFGPNADAKIAAALQSNYAAEKIRMLARPKQASQLLRQLKAESRFAAGDQAILQNSKTALRTEAQKALPRVNNQDAVPGELRRSSLSGLLLEGVYRAANTLAGGSLERSAQRSIEDQARILVSNGAQAQQLIKDLIAYNNRQGQAKLGAAAIKSAVQAIMSGSRQAVQGAAVSDRSGGPQDLPVQRDANGRIVLDVYLPGDPRNPR